MSVTVSRTYDCVSVLVVVGKVAAIVRMSVKGDHDVAYFLRCFIRINCVNWEGDG